CALVLLEGAGTERSAGVDLDRQIALAVLGDFLCDIFVELDDAVCWRKERRKLELFREGFWPRSIHRAQQGEAECNSKQPSDIHSHGVLPDTAARLMRACFLSPVPK